jgi:hypothetical protein
MLTAIPELGGTAATSEPHNPFAAADGPDEHAAAPIPKTPARITPASARPRDPPLLTDT